MTRTLLASVVVNVALAAVVAAMGVTTYQLDTRLEAVEAVVDEPVPGPRGPQGPPGAPGPAGPAGEGGRDGADGIDGTDGAACGFGRNPSRVGVVTDVSYGYAFRDQPPPLEVQRRFVQVCD